MFTKKDRERLEFLEERMRKYETALEIIQGYAIEYLLHKPKDAKSMSKTELERAKETIEEELKNRKK